MSQLNSLWAFNYRVQVARLLEALAELRELRKQYDALGFATDLTDADCAEPGFEVTADQVRGAVTSVDQIDNYIGSNWHYTILYKVARK